MTKSLRPIAENSNKIGLTRDTNNLCSKKEARRCGGPR